MAPWCSGLTRLPVKEEIGSSNLLGVAIKQKLKTARSNLGAGGLFRLRCKLFAGQNPWRLADR